MTRVKEWGLLASVLERPGTLENGDTPSQEGYSTAAATAMAMFPPNTLSLRRRPIPMRLLSKVTQQWSGWRKQSTYRSSVLTPIDLLFKSSTWVQSYKTQEKKNNKSHSYQGQWPQILAEQFLYPNHSTKPSVSVESKFWRCQETSLDTNLSLTLQILHKHSENFKFFHAHQSKWPKRAENLRRRSRKESGVFIPHKDKRGMIRRYRGTQGSALTGHTEGK